MLTVLLVDADAAARARTGRLLQLAGWQVHEATDSADALRLAPALDPDVVVADVAGPDDDGLALLRRLRMTGSRARFLVVTGDPSVEVRAAATVAGALACLAKPVDRRVLTNFLRGRTTGPAVQDSPTPLADVDDLHEADWDADLMDRLQEMYMNALPDRLSAITTGARSGDAPAVASAAHTLAGTSSQLGHPEVASICRAIAHDARRGVFAHNRIVELSEMARA
jgi:CheY-like chemotaxis protein